MNLSAIFSPALSLLAQASQPTTAGAAAASTQATTGKAPGLLDFLATPMFPLLLGIIVLYVFMFRSRKKQQRKEEEARNQIKKGDEVQTIGGVLGKVIEVRDAKVLLKVDETSNTKIWFGREAIRKVLTEEKAEAAK